jgi:hypothetical protein
MICPPLAAEQAHFEDGLRRRLLRLRLLFRLEPRLRFGNPEIGPEPLSEKLTQNLR